MTAIWVLMTIVNGIGWLLPAPADKLGWGLRARALEFDQPYLASESIGHNRVAVVLINQSKEEREYLYLGAARINGDLSVSLVRPDGKTIRAIGRRGSIQFKERAKLPAGQLDSAVFTFEEFGYDELPEPGEYELRASLKTAEGMVVAPVVKLKVIEPAPDAILVSQPVPLGGYQANWPKDKQEGAEMQQIKIGNRTWLIYRRFLSAELGGKVSNTFRLAELPGKVEMKVEGICDSLSPLTITYKDANSPTGTTKLVINSIDGMPWTEGEERLRQERNKLKKGETPAPSPAKP